MQYEYGRAETDIRTVQGGHPPVEGRTQGGIHPLRENDGGRERGAVPCRMPGHIQAAARNQAGMATVMV